MIYYSQPPSHDDHVVIEIVPFRDVRDAERMERLESAGVTEAAQLKPEFANTADVFRQLTERLRTRVERAQLISRFGDITVRTIRVVVLQVFDRRNPVLLKKPLLQV